MDSPRRKDILSLADKLERQAKLLDGKGRINLGYVSQEIRDLGMKGSPEEMEGFYQIMREWNN